LQPCVQFRMRIFEVCLKLTSSSGPSRVENVRIEWKIAYDTIEAYVLIMCRGCQVRTNTACSRKEDVVISIDRVSPSVPHEPAILIVTLVHTYHRVEDGTGIPCASWGERKNEATGGHCGCRAPGWRMEGLRGRRSRTKTTRANKFMCDLK
jgi:hypothetical protein